MRIIKVAQVIGKWVGAGAENVIFNYFKYIDKKKFKFDFICESDSTNIPYDTINKLGGRVILVSPYENTSKYINDLTEVFKKGEYNIVHSHTNALSYLSLKAAKKAKIPVRIAHSHNSSIKLEQGKLLKNIYKILLRQSATHYFACNEQSAKFLFGEKEYNSGNVFIISNAIEVDKFKYNKKNRIKKRKDLDIAQDNIVIGHVGRFISQKNHEFILDLFKSIHDKNPKTILMLCGQGPLMKEIREKAYSMGIYDDIKFLGQVSDIDKCYQAMDLFILPSFYEGFPLTLIEAQAAGLPCFASTDVGEECMLLNSTTLLKLGSPLKIWRKLILESLVDFEKVDTTEEIKAKGYNIEDEVKKLEKKYIELTK